MDRAADFGDQWKEARGIRREARDESNPASRLTPLLTPLT